MKKIVFFMILALITVSCMTEKQAREKYPCTGSVVFKVHRDTTYIPSVIETKILPDSAWLQALIVCDSTGKAYIREIQKLKTGKHTVPFVHIGSGNILTAGAKVDSFAVYTAYKKQYIHETDQETITLPPVQVKYVPKFIQFFAWSGAVLWLFVIVFFGIKLFNLVRKVWPI
jgi:hypothetical protein